MARNNRWKESRDKRDSGAFLSVPMSVLNSRAYLDASARARMLLFDLFSQYRGDNNGDLCAAWKLMKPRGWRSEETLASAKRELLELRLIVETRKGARPNKASLYGIPPISRTHSMMPNWQLEVFNDNEAETAVYG